MTQFMCDQLKYVRKENETHCLMFFTASPVPLCMPILFFLERIVTKEIGKQLNDGYYRSWIFSVVSGIFRVNKFHHFHCVATAQRSILNKLNIVCYCNSNQVCCYGIS